MASSCQVGRPASASCRTSCVPQRVDAEEQPAGTGRGGASRCRGRRRAPRRGRSPARRASAAPACESGPSSDHGDLHQADQQPAGGIEGVFHQVAEAQAEQPAAAPRLRTALLHLAEGVGQESSEKTCRVIRIGRSGPWAPRPGLSAARKTGMLAQRREAQAAALRPTISGSSTAGAQGSWRDQMPRCASRTSPGWMSRSAAPAAARWGACRSAARRRGSRPASTAHA
jgi:hypothetical protein